MNSPDYTLRVSVKVLGEKPINGLESEPSFLLGSVKVTVKQSGRFLILRASGFASEIDARMFLPRIKTGLWNVALEHNIAFEPYFEFRSITRFEDPMVTAHNLARSLGQPHDGVLEPVHGITEEEGCTIYRSGENIRYLSMSGTARVSTGWERFSSTLAEGMRESSLTIEELDEKLATAIDLYLAHFYENSTRARFLTLIICLELLAPVTDKHPTAIRLLSMFKEQIEVARTAAIDADEIDALDTLLNQIEINKETSKRRRLRSLVLTEAPLGTDARKILAKKVIAGYDLRSAVVHTGAVSADALSEAHQIVLQTVKLLLRVRLGIPALPQDEPSANH